MTMTEEDIRGWGTILAVIVAAIVHLLDGRKRGRDIREIKTDNKEIKKAVNGDKLRMLRTIASLTADRAERTGDPSHVIEAAAANAELAHHLESIETQKPPETPKP